MPDATSEELELVAPLRRRVEHLAGKIGERSSEEMWGLAGAADYLFAELEGMGYSVERQGYEVGESVALNLAVDVPGGSRGQEIVVVGAHYDTVAGSPGADDNASGVAALLTLAERFANTRHQRSLRFVFFSHEEPPHFQQPTMGSLVYAKQAVGRGDDVWFMISLESLGFFRDAENSQKYPAQLADKYPTTGDFLAVVGNVASRQKTDMTAGLLRKHGSLPIEAASLRESLPGVSWSDQWAFWQLGIPAVMITDTAPFRNPHYHKSTDTPDRLDYPRMARAVVAIAGALGELAGGPQAKKP